MRRLPTGVRRCPLRDVLLIIRREFKERVASRSFLVVTLIFPTLIAGLIILPRFIGSGGTVWNLALVSEAPPGVADAFTTALTRPADSSDANTYRLTAVETTVSTAGARLAADLDSKKLDGYIALPADVLQTGKVVFRSRKGASFAVVRDIRIAATRAVQSARLARSGIPPSSVAALIAPVDVDDARLTTEGEQAGGAMSTFITAYAVAFLIYIMTTLYGVAVMRSVLEEKTNRIAEVLMSTIRASHLMAGKIIGVGSAAVAQVLIWVAITTVIVTQSKRFGEGFTLPAPLLQALDVSLPVGLLLFAYFVVGFFLYASVFAMVGAAVTSEQEAQSVQFLALIPLIVPMMFLETILNAPLGGLSTALGILPFTAPVTMPMRLAASPIPPVQIALSLVLLAVGIVVVAWMAGKIYRVGMLSTGKRVSLGELVRWIRAA